MLIEILELKEIKIHLSIFDKWNLWKVYFYMDIYPYIS